MRILLDENPCEIPAGTVGEAIAIAAEAAEKAGRLVVEVRVDGATLTDEELQTTTRLQDAAEEVQMLTTTMEALLRDTFLQAAETLTAAEREQRLAAEAMQGGRAAEGMASLMQSLEGWSGIRDAVVQGLSLAEIPTEDVEFDGVRLADAIVDLQKRLGRLKDAMVAEDVSATCDCLLYELPESTTAWRTLLDGLHHRFEAASEDAGDSNS